jgi:hypothetical protein
MSYGDDGGAVGYLVGEENRGLECMFTMMNNARLAVGLQGVAIAERAYQQARAYARERVQGRPVTEKGDAPLPIIHHPDMRRMLLSMRAHTEAMRALAYYTAATVDRARHQSDAGERAAMQRRADLLTPVVKAWCTDLGFAVASTGIQVHGGVGYIEETGAAQHLRDARIAAIYEGTNGIQANDLVGRKLLRDGGAAAQALTAEMRALDALLAEAPGDDMATIRHALAEGVDAFAMAGAGLIASAKDDPARPLAGAVPFLDLAGTVIAGWLMAQGALAAHRRLRERQGDPRFLEAKLLTARFFAEHELAHAPALLPAVLGGATVMAVDLDQL